METHGMPQPSRIGDADGAVEQLNLFSQASQAPRSVAGVPDPAWPLVRQQADGQGRGASRALWGRRVLAGVVGLGLGAALLPKDAWAAIPVVDVAAIAQIVATVGKLTTQITLLTNQYNAFVNNTRKLTSGYAWRDIGTTIATVDGVVASGRALTYSTAGLAAELGVTFPGYSYDPLTAVADLRAQKERALSTVMQQLLANQRTGTQLAMSVARLATMKGQVAGISSAQQAAEVNATVGVLAAEETALLRQQILAAGSAQAVVAAEALN